jgi:predicted nucleic acid-binding protein
MTIPVFVDTSAVYAALDVDDVNNPPAVAGMERLLIGAENGSHLPLTHSAVVTEVVALVQRRLGMTALRVVLEYFVPSIEVVWVDADLHRRAASALLAADRRGVSLVDWTSFLVMRDRAIEVAFAFDEDFAAQGFELFAG